MVLPVYKQAYEQVRTRVLRLFTTLFILPKITSIFKADLVAFNKEILQISEIKDLQPATTIPCYRANEARQILVSLALKHTQIVLSPKYFIRPSATNA